MMKPGNLIHYRGVFSPRFCPVTSDGKIDNSLSWRERIPVNKQENSILLFVEPLDYATATVTEMATATVEAAMATEMATATLQPVTGMATGMATGMVARKEFEETGKIPGGVFLLGDSRKIWVSHYDLKELVK